MNTEQVVTELFDVFDTNKDGVISRGEFVHTDVVESSVSGQFVVRVFVVLVCFDPFALYFAS